jgi:hypothetical protein
MSDSLRSHWQNCCGLDDKDFLNDKERQEIDAMEDAISPLDEQTVSIRQLITRFELCYHEADKEAESIIRGISSGKLPPQSSERPPQRKRELQNSHDILSAWCRGALAECKTVDVGGIAADKLVTYPGKPTPLKIWQVQRVVDKIKQALDSSYQYHRMALDVGDYGEPGAEPVGRHYKDDSGFLTQTVGTVIHDTVDGRKAEISLAIAIDLLMPCHWDFVGGLVIILKAIGGDLHPKKPYACCSRNIRLSPLCDRMRIISNTLGAFWRSEETAESIDRSILASLGEPTPVKRWLAASLDKTIRAHLSFSFEMDLV